MKSKRVVIGILAFLLIAVVASLAVQPKRTEVPPGVLPDAWIPISDNAGVALNLFAESPRGKGGTILRSGTLMVKSHGLWEKVYLEQPPANSFLPVR
jgi:hypothetical protein